MELSVAQILEVSQARLVSGPPTVELRGCSIDSRKVSDRHLFVCFPGERVDGNDFCMSALEAGASCVALTRNPLPEELRCAQEHHAALLVLQEEPTQFLTELASLWRSMNSWYVVGVTGSVGKTTTRLMIEAALSPKFQVHATKANLNSTIGSSLTILDANTDDEVLVVEMGMDHAGEILQQAKVARPHIGVITNIGSSHLANLGSRDAIANAKAELLSGLEPHPHFDGAKAHLVMCGEDDYAELIGVQYAHEQGIDTTFVGCQERDALSSSSIELDDAGCAHFSLRYQDGEVLTSQLSMPGSHAVGDALLALATAELLGVDRLAALDGVAACKPYKMRLEAIELPGKPRLIDDSYNAAPTSMKAALEVLAYMACEGRRIAVLGQMAELGPDEEQLHREVGASVAEHEIDMLVVIGNVLANSLADAARAGGMNPDAILSFKTVEEASAHIIPNLDSKDLVLVKASRSAGLDAFAREVISS